MCVCVGLQEAVIGIVRLQCVSVKEREIETLCVCVAQQGTVIGMLVLQCVCERERETHTHSVCGSAGDCHPYVSCSVCV